jgi:hypothetical protein
MVYSYFFIFSCSARTEKIVWRPGGGNGLILPTPREKGHFFLSCVKAKTVGAAPRTQPYLPGFQKKEIMVVHRCDLSSSSDPEELAGRRIQTPAPSGIPILQ